MLASTKTLGSFIDRDPIVVPPATTVHGACRQMNEESVGILLVVDRTGLRGVFSERDVVRAIADDTNVDTERVSNWMAEDVLALDAGTTVPEALEAMADNEIRHVVVSRDGEPVGVVSQRMLLAAVLHDD